jgi:hypothetical protein
MSSAEIKIPNPIDSTYLKVRSRLGAFGSKRELSKVRNSFLFVGYPHSGHSLVGAFIDAHPQACCSHELDALYYFEKGYSTEQIFWLIKRKSIAFRSDGNTWNQHNYQFHSGQQGSFHNLISYGDKKGGRSNRRIIQDPDILTAYRDSLPFLLKLIHVYRHPLDQLDRRLKHRVSRTGETEERAINRILQLQEEAMRNVSLLESKFDLLHVSLEQLLMEPKKEGAKIFEFLHLHAFEPLLQELEKKLDTKHLDTGRNREWETPIMSTVEEWTTRFPFLSVYSK